ncbi:metallophosphoesterase [Cutibacterium equinum]|uniref:Metallophosphoesterase n=1 Tax=Cutibacterium equinum TaxID=3016342 RepID=A0ABY7QYL5_9ACTN|nr:metallophosphoesterase [Cutibacterium equinum]WCC79800.1 metallophosphoesterase [Cutibacterium equinum]
MKTWVKAAAGMVGLGLSGLTYGVVEAHRFVVRHLEVPVLKPGSSLLRVLHVSDFHALARQKDKRQFIRGLADLEPDLVIDTGDNFCSADSLQPLLDDMAGLLERPGAFVFGSNDYLAPSFTNPFTYLLRGRSRAPEKPVPELPHEQLRQAFTSAGWLDLNDKSGTLEVEGHRLAFRGTDDAHHHRDHYEKVAGPADGEASLNIGVTHAPYLKILDAMIGDGMDIVFAGHTHGGQVCLPVKGAIITNCDLDTDRVKGLSQHSSGGRTGWLHVSAGVGSSPYAPYRTFCRPEVTLLTLVPRS